MEENKIDKIIESFEELDLGDIYTIKSTYYCGEPIIEIKECDAGKHHIYIHPDIVQLVNKNRLQMAVQNVGNGEDYMRIIII